MVRLDELKGINPEKDKRTQVLNISDYDVKEYCCKERSVPHVNFGDTCDYVRKIFQDYVKDHPRAKEHEITVPAELFYGPKRTTEWIYLLEDGKQALMQFSNIMHISLTVDWQPKVDSAEFKLEMFDKRTYELFELINVYLRAHKGIEAKKD